MQPAGSKPPPLLSVLLVATSCARGGLHSSAFPDPPPEPMMASAELATPQEKALRRKLSLMMFLQIFIWGAWFELGFDYIPSLKFSGWQNSLIFGAFNIGALVALLFSTQFADRKFAAEKFLGSATSSAGRRSSALFFLQAPVGTGIGEVATVTITGPGPTITRVSARCPNKHRVLVENVVETDDKDKTARTPGQAKLRRTSRRLRRTARRRNSAEDVGQERPSSGPCSRRNGRSTTKPPRRSGRRRSSRTRDSSAHSW